MKPETNPARWRFETEDAFVSLSGKHRRVADPLSWRTVLLFVFGYAVATVLDRFIPNPMLPGASLALAMVIPVVAGALRGPREGALVGFGGTLLALVFHQALFGFNAFEACGLAAHPVMGACAGLLARRTRHRIVPGLAILLGHGLNLAAYTLFHLMPVEQLKTPVFLTALLAESAVDLILYSLTFSLIRALGPRKRPVVFNRRILWAWSSVLAPLLLLSWAYQSGMVHIEGILVLPVALSAILLGPLASLLTALAASSLLFGTILEAGIASSRTEIMTVLGLNLVALVLGELAAGVRQQERLARKRAGVLSAMSHSAEQLLEQKDWEKGLTNLLSRLAEASESPAIALYREKGSTLEFSIASGEVESGGFPEEVSVDSEHLEKGRNLVGAGGEGLSGFPKALLIPVFSGEKAWGALMILAHQRGTPWSSPVRDALRVAADLLGAAVYRRTIEAALSTSRERYALAARGASDGLWDWDLVEDRLYLSDRWHEMLGYEPTSLESRVESWLQLVEASDRVTLERRIKDHLEGAGERLETEYRIKHRDGSYRWMLCRGLAIRNKEGKATRMAGSQTDITERKRAEEQILRNAFYDQLTRLPNRALFLDRLKIACRRSGDHPGEGLAVLLTDIDRLKLVNDSYGHRAGDELIRLLARSLEKISGPDRTLARVGSDGFALLIEEDDALERAREIADRINEKLARPFDIENHEVFATMSMGIAPCMGGATPPEELLQDADTALAEAKARGRARIVVFEKKMRDMTVRRLGLETELRRAIEDRQLRLYYQPIVRLNDGELSGFEALLRWENPVRGLLGPGEFINVAEEAGLIVGLGEWALKEACLRLELWKRRFPGKRITISVNLHSHQLRQSDLVQLVARTLKDLDLSSDILRLEVTEQAMLEDQRIAVGMMRELQQLGINLYVDDFGTGYSSLAYLVRLPVSTLKIDQSFIMGMEDNPRKRQMVEVILQLARTLGLEVVAEGIEKQIHLEFLRAGGCQYGQGFLFARPLPAEHAENLIGSGKKPVDWEFRS